MGKIKIKNILISTFIFVLATAFILGEGFYRKTLAKETASFTITLNNKSTKPVVFDIANEGLAKRLVQPGKISISSGHGVGVFNKGKEPLFVQVKAKGFSGDVDITSTEVSFEKETGKFDKALKPGAGINLSITLSIPRDEIKRNTVTSGSIEFTDYKSGNILGELPIKVINSTDSITK